MKTRVIIMVIIFFGSYTFSQDKSVESDGMIRSLPVMEYVTGGVFTMGTDFFLNKVEEKAAPAHRVELSDFVMARTLVTQRLWDLFIQDTDYRGYTYYHGYYGTIEKNIQGPDSPAIFMTWSEAVVFCNWLSQKMGLDQAYRITGKLDPELRGGIEAEWIRGTNGYRLVTEAEWEYVMYERGSPREVLIETYKTAFDRPQQKPLPDAWSGQFTSFNVMAYPNFGITEMTWDEYGGFSNQPEKDPTGLSGLHSRGVRKVRRYFIDSILFHRYSMKIADNEGGFIGIRLAQDRL